MRPLLKKELDGFLKRFGSFVDAELLSAEILSSRCIKISFNAQDSARDFDWVGIELEFDSVFDAQLPPQNEIHLIDMQGGISIKADENGFLFHIVNYSSCSIKSSSLKFFQKSF